MSSETSVRRAMTDFKNLKVQHQGDIAVVEFNQENSKVNTLSQGMTDEFVSLFAHLQNHADVKGIVVISSKPGSFIAGADINMIESIQSRDELYRMSRHGQEIMDRIEQSAKPIIVAIAGSCLGGGFEVALACHYRIALDDKRTGFGVPEVKLGLLPGAGGTQRLLQKLSLSEALDLLLTGREIKAKRAKAMGLVNLLVEPVGNELEDMEHLRTIAIQKANQLTAQRTNKRQVGLLESIKSTVMSSSYVRNYILSQAQAKVLAQTQGLYPAPLRILDVVKHTLDRGFASGFVAEAKAFADLAMTDESKALINLFDGRTECKKNKYGTPEREIKSLAVVGANEVGAGIAHVSLDKNLQVILHDPISDALVRGQLQIRTSYQSAVQRNRITHTEYNRILANLKCQTTSNDLNLCDFIIETELEDLQLKRKSLIHLEQCIPAHCIVALQTSIIPIDQVAAQSRRPEQVIGMHYFSPVEKVELLEIIRAKQTSDETVRAAVHLGLKQGKIAIVVSDAPGFYTTRLLTFASAEVFSLLREDLSAKDIDQATKKFGFHLGLASLLDEFGIDTIAGLVGHLHPIFGERLTDTSVLELLHVFIRNSLFGRKSKQGLYLYSKENKRENHQKIKQLLNQSSLQMKERSTTETIQWRITLRLLNEAAKCLEEAVIGSPTDGDIGAVFGLGFPPMKGGPFHFMDTYGISNIVELMHRYQSHYGDRFAPAPSLIEMAKENRTFYP